MRYEKKLFVKLGEEKIKLGVSDAPSFFACDEAIVAELERLDIPRNKEINSALKLQEE